MSNIEIYSLSMLLLERRRLGCNRVCRYQLERGLLHGVEHVYIIQ